MHAVHILVDSPAFLRPSASSSYVDNNDDQWNEPPVGLSLVEFEALQLGGKGGVAANNANSNISVGGGIANGVGAGDVHGRMGMPVAPYAHEYVPIPSSHDMLGNAHAHREGSDRGIDDGHREKRSPSNESMVK